MHNPDDLKTLAALHLAADKNDRLAELARDAACEIACLRQFIESARIILAPALVKDDPLPRYILDEVVEDAYRVLDAGRRPVVAVLAEKSIDNA